MINRRAIELLAVLPEAFSFRPLNYSDIHAFLSDRGEFRNIQVQLGSTASGALKAGQPFDMPRVYERERPNGTILEVRTTDIPSGGLVRTFTDITDRTRNERAIAEARDSAETASRTQATFLAMMSHELRTPMNAVIGLTSMLIETSLDEVQRTYARIINTSAEHLLNIINNILDFSRLKAGHEKPEVAVFEVRDMIASVIEIVRSLPNADGIAISTERRIRCPGLSMWRFRPGYAGPAELSQQRRKIHDARNRRIRGVGHGAAGPHRHAAICRDRHRHRDFSRRAAQAVRPLRARRHRANLPIRRHRSRPGYQQKGRGVAGRGRDGRKRRWRGVYIRLRAALRHSGPIREPRRNRWGGLYRWR